jgi:antitoxin ParD1/3/4
MRSTMNVSLPADLKRWVDEQVEAGGYGTASEYLRDVLRRDREREARRRLDESLVKAVAEGADTVMDDGDWASMRRAARAQAARNKRAR